MKWCRVADEKLDGSTLFIGIGVTGLWFVYDGNDPTTMLTDWLPKRTAKRAAERIHEQRAKVKLEVLR